jgi:hypothetical protein
MLQRQFAYPTIAYLLTVLLLVALLCRCPTKRLC